MAKKASSEFIDIPKLIAQYRSKWYYFLISLIVCAGLGFAYIKLKTPMYGVRANVLISQDDNGGLPSFGGLGDIFGSSGYVEDEIFVVSSHTVFRDVARDLGLNKVHTVKYQLVRNRFMYKDFPVDVITPAGLCDTLSVPIVFKVKVNDKGMVDATVKAKKKTIAEVENAQFPVTVETKYGNFVISKTPYLVPDETTRTTITVMGYHAAAELLAHDVASDIASKHSNVIALAIKTPIPEYGKDILNDIITKYNERGIAQKNLQSEKTAQFLDERIALIAGDLATAETELQDFKEKKGIYDVRAEASYNMQMKGTTEQQLLAAQTENEIIKMTRDFLANPDNAYSLIPTTVGEGSGGSAISAYNSLILRRLNLQSSAKSNNRSIKLLDEQIDALRDNINTSLAKAYENSNVKVRELQRELSRAQGRLGNIPEQERSYLNLARQQNIKNELYLFLLQRREETAMLLANAVPKGIIVDEAYTLKDPLGMGKMMIMLIALICGIGLPAVILYLQRTFCSKLTTREDIEERTDLPLLGEICNVTDADGIVVGNNSTTSVAELFRLLRTNLQFMIGKEHEKVVLVTSTKSGEGKSFVSTNLAASFAIMGKKTLLVGMDIRNPQLANYLHIPGDKGVTQYLSGTNTDLDSLIIQEPNMPNLDVMVSGPIPPNPGELLSSESVDKLMEVLRSRYDIIIVDSAPVGMVSDTLMLDRISDVTVYVTRVNVTTRQDMEFLENIADNKQLKRISLVVNGTKRSTGYGYGYGAKQNKSN